MAWDRKQVSRLIALAELQWQSRAQALAARTRDERIAAAALRALNEERAQARAEADQSNIPAMRALETWEAWSIQELTRRSARQATDRAALLEEKAHAAVALSRREAARTLGERVRKEAQHRQDKRDRQALLDIEMARASGRNRL